MNTEQLTKASARGDFSVADVMKDEVTGTTSSWPPVPRIVNEPPRQYSVQSRDYMTPGDGSFSLRRPQPVEGGVSSDHGAQKAPREPLHYWADSPAQPTQDINPSLRLEQSYSQIAPSTDDGPRHAWEAASLNMSFGGSHVVGRALLAVDVRPVQPQLRNVSDDPTHSLKKSPQAHTVFNSATCQPDSSRDVSSLSTMPHEMNNDSSLKRSSHTDASASTATTYTPVISFSERLRQSRMAITEQVVSQRKSPSKPIQSAIGRLPQFRSHKPLPKTAGGFGAAGTLLGPPIIRAVAEMPQQHHTESQFDTEPSPPRPQSFGFSHHTFKYPTFPISPAHTKITNDINFESKGRFS